MDLAYAAAHYRVVRDKQGGRLVKPPRIGVCGRLATMENPHAADAGAKPPTIKVGTTGQGGKKATLSGLAACGLRWECARCAAADRSLRAAEIDIAGQQWLDQGGQLVMLTLTVRHDAGMGLERLYSTVADAWRGVTAHRSWKRLGEQMGLIGTYRATEVTHGKSGWHPHIHVLLFLGGKPTEAGPWTASRRVLDLRHLEEVAWQLWSGQIGQAWPEAMPERGPGVNVMRMMSTGRYLAKVQDDGVIHLDGDVGARAAAELARGDLKVGRSGSRTPFAVLHDWADETRDHHTRAADYATWVEYVAVTRGRRSIERSPRLWDRLGREEPTVEELTEQQEKLMGEDQVEEQAEVWIFSREEIEVIRHDRDNVNGWWADLLQEVEQAPDPTRWVMARLRALGMTYDDPPETVLRNRQVARMMGMPW